MNSYPIEALLRPPAEERPSYRSTLKLELRHELERELVTALDRFATAFYEPLVFSRPNFEQWTEDGSRHTDERATAVWERALAEYEPPPLDEGVAAAMDDFVERRVAEGGAAPD